MAYVLGKKTGKRYDTSPHSIIAKGGEGTTYRDGDVCIKVNQEKVDARYEFTIETLARVLKHIANIACPIEVALDSKTKEPIGFVMPFVEGESLETIANARRTSQWSELEKVLIAISIVEIVLAFHKKGTPTKVLGDVLNANNVIVNGTKVKLVDIGSVSILRHRATSGEIIDTISSFTTPGYTPVEVLNNPKALPSHSADLFALGVLLYLVIHGRIPTDPKPSSENVGILSDESVKRGLFVRYINDPDFQAPKYDAGFTVPDEIDGLHRAAFLSLASDRPTAKRWLEALTAWHERLTTKERAFQHLMRTVLLGLGVFLLALCVVGWALYEANASNKVPPHSVGSKSDADSIPETTVPDESFFPPGEPVGPKTYREIFK